MTNISALDALKAAVSASDTVTKQTSSGADFSSFLKTDKNLEEIYQEAAITYGVSADLLKAMTKQESNFNPNSTSRSGAQGLMQLMPATAASLGVTNAYDPYQNIMGGAKYIRQMLDRYNGNVSLALAAYNAGCNNVDKYGGIPPFAETQNYVAKITQYLEEGVAIPDTQTVYAAESTVSGSSEVSYQDLNQLAGNILAEIFSYDDYMKVLSSLLGKEEERLALSLTVVSPDSEEEEEERVLEQSKTALLEKEEAKPADSYIAFQNLARSSVASSIIVK